MYGGTSKFASFYVSRIDFPSNFFDEQEPDEKRIKRLPKKGPKIGIFHLWPSTHTWKEENLKDGFCGFVPLLAGRGNYDERLMVSYLGLLFQGQLSPSELMKCIEPEAE